MSNEEILNKRWKKTDKILKEYLKKFKNLDTEVIDNLVEMYGALDIGYSDLNKPISNYEKRKLDRKFKEWKKLGILTGYFEYLVSSKRKYTYSDLLEILIYGIYAEQESKKNELSKKIFIEVANDIYNQAYDEISIKPKKKEVIDWNSIEDLLWISIYNKSWREYLNLLTITAQQEMYKEITGIIQQERKLDGDMLKDLVKRQSNRFLSINTDKYSGALSDTCRALGNEVYIESFKSDKDLQVRFIAEMDKRTTKMCESMNNMLFYVNDWNKFYRYSDIDGKDVLYTIKGLVQGINLPPINNHFHWCRSTVTYQIDMSRNELNKKLQNWNEQNAIHRWLSSDFYKINYKMYNNMSLTQDERKLVKDLYRALNKQPNYESKEDEMIVRVLEVDDRTTEDIVLQHSIGKAYKTKSFESYSLKDGYNENANVFFYVKGSKKAKSLLEYNSIDNEAEVVYQYGTKFVTRKYEKINNKHYFLMEEL